MEICQPWLKIRRNQLVVLMMKMINWMHVKHAMGNWRHWMVPEQTTGSCPMCVLEGEMMEMLDTSLQSIVYMYGIPDKKKGGYEPHE